MLNFGTSLVIQWRKICLQGKWVCLLVWDDSTCAGTTKPSNHKYWDRVQQLQKPVYPEPVPHLRRSHHSEKLQFRSVAQSCPTLCNPMNHSTPGLPVHHQLPEFTQTHVHRVSDAIQPSHPLSSPSPPAPSPSQHQSLFQWVNSSHEVAKVLEFQL